MCILYNNFIILSVITNPKYPKVSHLKSKKVCRTDGGIVGSFGNILGCHFVIIQFNLAWRRQRLLNDDNSINNRKKQCHT